MNRKVTAVSLALALTLMGCATVKPGNVGVKVYQSGSKRGELEKLEVGRYAVNPLTEDVYQFPTFRQNLVWQRNEDPDKNEEITFNSSEGATFSADVALSYSFDADKATTIFSEFRQPADVIADTVVRRITQDSFNRIGSSMKANDIYGEGKIELLDRVTEDLKKELGEDGFNVHTLSVVALRTDPKVQESINGVITAKQEAEKARQRVEQVKAEGEAAIAKATAESEANRLKEKSLSDALLQYEAILRWNGELPSVTSGATPFVNLTPNSKPAK
jgi:regulator of protease activity HflC (stomatin/prohibitin superfamily)